MALVRDPYFWKRFSTAVHRDDQAKTQSQLDLEQAIKKQPDSWLERERQKRKRSLICGFIIFFCIILAVTGGVVVWWLAKHNWLQSPEP
ncbi:hypothetical protein N7509_008004 [Penicillium cosmopolitanum]|uniref:Uncharacterized protein n=1 Tax=Penicillium cosmopolitanum TaxID=1131564 RepID=A0A9W9W009_9EURO|nr:uncharacterized protein N7509_008004 [Penicillium cosmopolitanum]XP_057118652.1 uncharacterized protein N7481_008756 [Penicillium waksmanii]KAJ5392514.1 hypothetical protein N7509_008004 [Penicillium cosmopolitanum]KAJ5975049.1 hypothetical protein N7481_008756 [Penicillium waksmanii]